MPASAHGPVPVSNGRRDDSRALASMAKFRDLCRENVFESTSPPAPDPDVWMRSAFATAVESLLRLMLDRLTATSRNDSVGFRPTRGVLYLGRWISFGA